MALTDAISQRCEIPTYTTIDNLPYLLSILSIDLRWMLKQHYPTDINKKSKQGKETLIFFPTGVIGILLEMDRKHYTDLTCRVCLNIEELMVNIYEEVEDFQSNLVELLEACGGLMVCLSTLFDSQALYVYMIPGRPFR